MWANHSAMTIATEPSEAHIQSKQQEERKETTMVSGKSTSQIYKECLWRHLGKRRWVYLAHFLIPFVFAFSENYANFNSKCCAFLGLTNWSRHFPYYWVPLPYIRVNKKLKDAFLWISRFHKYMHFPPKKWTERQI